MKRPELHSDCLNFWKNELKKSEILRVRVYLAGKLIFFPGKMLTFLRKFEDQNLIQHEGTSTLRSVLEILAQDFLSYTRNPDNVVRKLNQDTVIRAFIRPVRYFLEVISQYFLVHHLFHI